MTKTEQNDPGAQAVRELREAFRLEHCDESKRQKSEAVITLFEQAQQDLATMRQDRDDADKAMERAQRERDEALQKLSETIQKCIDKNEALDDLTAKLVESNRLMENFRGQVRISDEALNFHLKRANELDAKCERLEAAGAVKQNALKDIQRWLIKHTDIEGENPLLDDVVSPAVRDDCGQPLLDENKRLRGALEHIAEYWNGNFNERACADAAEHTQEIARKALATPGKEMKHGN